MSNVLIPCQCCGQNLPKDYTWFICKECHFRVCPQCQHKHKGRHSNGGYKCSQCAFGILEIRKA